MTESWEFLHDVADTRGPVVGGFRAPSHIIARRTGGSGPSISVEFTVRGGRVEVASVRFTATEGRQVRPSDLAKLDLNTLAEQATAVALTEVEESAPGVYRIKMHTTPSTPQRRAASKARTQTRTPRVSDEQLREVAKVYRAAIEHGDPPNQAVQRHLGCQPRTAGLWITRARKAGHLGPAPGRGKAGEGEQ